MRTRGRARLPAVVAVFTAAILLALAGAVALASEAADTHVLVYDNAYHDGDEDDPTTTVIEAGETIQWRWDDGNENWHTVTADDGSFDSDDECEDPGDRDDCGRPPNTFTVTFDEPGTYTYRCKQHGLSILSTPMRGIVEVVEPDPDASPSPSPSPGERRPQPSPSPDDGDADDENGDEDEREADGQRDARSSGQATRPPTQRIRPLERRSADQREQQAPDPDVAPEEPDFEPFPSPSPVDPTPTPEIGDDLAVDIPPPGGLPRSTLVAIAIGMLSLTIGAFAKVVLFGGAWG